MTVTPQTNATLKEIAQALLEHDNYVIVGHVSPDGDCIGSQLALWHALHRAGKKATCAFATDETSLEKSLQFLPGSESIVPAASIEQAECVICVDVPNESRMGEAAAALHAGASFTVTLDHHANLQRVSDLSYTDPDAAASALIVWELAKGMGVDRGGELALCAFTGLVTDTGRFQYQNTDAYAFACAAEMRQLGVDLALVCNQLFQRRSLSALKLENAATNRMELLMDGSLALTYVTLDDFKTTGAVKADADNIVNVLRSLDGVRVACTLRETEDNLRGSLRSKDDTDISIFARDHNGGGHKAASGFTLYGDIQSQFDQIKDELEEFLNEQWGLV